MNDSIRNLVSRRRATRLGLGGLGALLVVALAGCEIAGTGGEAGNFTFHDQTRTAGEFVQTNQELDRRIAAGARIDVQVRSNARIVTPQTATSSDPTVISVEKIAGNDVVLRAHAAGTARLTVSAEGTEDSVTLGVAEIGQTVINLFPVGELGADQPTLVVSDAVLLPGARIWGFVEQRGPDGELLTGYGATPCDTADADGNKIGAAVSMDDDSDAFTLDAPATAPAGSDGADAANAVVLSCGPTKLTLPLGTADDATELQAYDFFHETFGPAFTVEPGQSTYLVVLARDAGGRIVQGAGGEAVVVDIPAATAPYVEVVAHEEDNELDDLFRQSRAVELRFSARTDPITLDLGWHGLTTTLEVTVQLDSGMAN